MSKEIKSKIDKLFAEREKEFTSCIFILNKRLIEIDKEIEALQAQCKHNFNNKKCEFCYKEED